MSKQDKLITLCLCVFTVAIVLLDVPTKTSVVDSNAPGIAHNFFATTTVEARAAYVYDIMEDRELYAKNKSTPLPLASITKIMTAVTASDLAPLSTIITIDSQSLDVEGDSGLLINERWTLSKLIQYMLVASSNDGAAAVASSLGFLATKDPTADNIGSFVTAMNKKVVTLGFGSMHFTNPSGLDESPTLAGAYGSADDVAHLLSFALKNHPDLIEPTRYQHFQVSSLDNIVHNADNTDIIASKIPSLIGGKTGYTDLAGGNLAIIFDAGIQRPIAVVVLGSTYDGRFEDVQKLVSDAIRTISSGN